MLVIYKYLRHNHKILCYDLTEKRYKSIACDNIFQVPGKTVVYHIELENKVNLIATGNIELLSSNGFVRLDNILKDDLIYLHMFMCKACNNLFYSNRIKRYCSDACRYETYKTHPTETGDMTDYLSTLEVDTTLDVHNRMKLFKVTKCKRLVNKETVHMIPDNDGKQVVIINNFIVKTNSCQGIPINDYYTINYNPKINNKKVIKND